MLVAVMSERILTHQVGSDRMVLPRPTMLDLQSKTSLSECNPFMHGHDSDGPAWSSGIWIDADAAAAQRKSAFDMIDDRWRRQPNTEVVTSCTS